MTKRGFSRIEAVVLLALLTIAATVLLPVFTRKNAPPRGSCLSRLKHIGLALSQYTEDYDQHFPPIALANVSESLPPYSVQKPTYGWADTIQPYIKKLAIYQCPTEADYGWKEDRDATQTGFTDYWFNRQLAGTDRSKLKSPATSIAAGDGNDGAQITDARYSLSSLPPKWIDDKTSPAHRHLGFGNYLFADGHAKGYKPSALIKGDKDSPSFVPR